MNSNGYYYLGYLTLWRIDMDLAIWHHDDVGIIKSIDTLHYNIAINEWIMDAVCTVPNWPHLFKRKANTNVALGY